MLIRRGLRGGYTSASTYLYEFSHYVQLFASNLVWTTQTQFTAQNVFVYIAGVICFFLNVPVTLEHQVL